DNKYHGTYVASSVAGLVNGVAKKANIHMIATDLDSRDDLAALDYIKSHANPHKTIINISRTYRYFSYLENKINELARQGFIITVSAGNDNVNACNGNRSYSGLDTVITAGYIDNALLTTSKTMEDMYRRASKSNYGSCVDIFAPGTIRITKEPRDNGLITSTGSSFASPFTAGVVALIMAENPEIEYNVKLMKETLISLSLKDKILDMPSSTPNRFLNNG
ncbi:hypothetical protein PIROE2DRAFT_34020, partial [Piromyces sp. E2]